MKQPDRVGGDATQTTYVVVTDADADAGYVKAQVDGARIAMQGCIGSNTMRVP